MTLCTFNDLTVTRDGHTVVDRVTLNVNAGEFVGLIGPNGAGKTTLMRAALGLLPATGGSSLASMSGPERARHVSWLPQDRRIAWPVTVETIVSLGRIPYEQKGRTATGDDQKAIEQALTRLDLQPLRHRKATELSGGEQARVLIARLLAQSTALNFADEPIAGLDPAYQLSTMEIFRRLSAGGSAVVASLHDLALAARFCTRLVLLHQGRVVADGPADAVLTPENIGRVFGIRARVLTTEDGPVFQPLEVLR